MKSFALLCLIAGGILTAMLFISPGAPRSALLIAYAITAALWLWFYKPNRPQPVKHTLWYLKTTNGPVFHHLETGHSDSLCPCSPGAQENSWVRLWILIGPDASDPARPRPPIRIAGVHPKDTDLSSLQIPPELL